MSCGTLELTPNPHVPYLGERTSEHWSPISSTRVLDAIQGLELWVYNVTALFGDKQVKFRDEL